MDQIYFGSTSIKVAGGNGTSREKPRDNRRSSLASGRGSDGGGGVSIDEL